MCLAPGGFQVPKVWCQVGGGEGAVSCRVGWGEDAWGGEVLWRLGGGGERGEGWNRGGEGNQATKGGREGGGGRTLEGPGEGGKGGEGPAWEGAGLMAKIPLSIYP